MEANNLSLRQKQSLSQNILLGLEYLHRNNIVHCDLKPQNIVIGINLTPVISDFDNSFDGADFNANATLATLGPLRVQLHLKLVSPP